MFRLPHSAKSVFQTEHFRYFCKFHIDSYTKWCNVFQQTRRNLFLIETIGRNSMFRYTFAASVYSGHDAAIDAAHQLIPLSAPWYPCVESWSHLDAQSLGTPYSKRPTSSSWRQKGGFRLLGRSEWQGVVQRTYNNTAMQDHCHVMSFDKISYLLVMSQVPCTVIDYASNVRVMLINIINKDSR